LSKERVSTEFFASQPNKKFQFFQKTRFPNPRPREIRIRGSYRVHARKKPRIPYLNSVGAIFVTCPNKIIFKGCIELDKNVVDGVRN
jgi:hypothetical protein